ncbi:hypothetical protein N7478_008377 [Penicillium angulare]|uniref:uncharacterized protein n=1 Tax=Penicillium angulare TaxID=116970 RepID=UPI00254025C8|nr:uncharacterized protein N7478_008377 [Penicillium angulare]KAJ5273252.1 hypothetical protein N7478_008377 [Penicillium angulare]
MRENYQIIQVAQRIATVHTVFATTSVQINATRGKAVVHARQNARYDARTQPVSQYVKIYVHYALNDAPGPVFIKGPAQYPTPRLAIDFLVTRDALRLPHVANSV